jgi:hypothetical protein
MSFPLYFPFTPPSFIFLLAVGKLLWFGEAVCEHPSKILSLASISEICGFVELVHTNVLALDVW